MELDSSFGFYTSTEGAYPSGWVSYSLGGGGTTDDYGLPWPTMTVGSSCWGWTYIDVSSLALIMVEGSSFMGNTETSSLFSWTSLFYFTSFFFYFTSLLTCSSFTSFTKWLSLFSWLSLFLSFSSDSFESLFKTTLFIADIFLLLITPIFSKSLIV